MLEYQEKLIGALIGLARATEGNETMITESTENTIVESLHALQANSNLDENAFHDLTERVKAEKFKLVPDCAYCAAPCGRTNDYDIKNLQNVSEEIRKMKMAILLGICDIASCTKLEEKPYQVLYRALYSIGMDDWGAEELQEILLEVNSLQK